MPLATVEDLRPLLDNLSNRFHREEWISSDPVQFLHRYSEQADQEVVGFISSCFAYGSVVLIHRALEKVLEPMGEHPEAFVRSYEHEKRWRGFYHRFHKEPHLEALIVVIRDVLRERGSLGEYFRSFADTSLAPGPARMERLLEACVSDLHSRIARDRGVGRNPAIERGVRFFFNAPSGGSACKRMAMFLRWMVRKDAVDTGLWPWFDPADLVIPVDTHIARLSYYLGLRGGREEAPPGWKMAMEVTTNLRAINPNDPVGYDFALTRLGILDLCQKRYASTICSHCDLAPGCRYSRSRTVACPQSKDYAAFRAKGVAHSAFLLKKDI